MKHKVIKGEELGVDDWRPEKYLCNQLQKQKCGECGWEGRVKVIMDHFCPKCGNPTSYDEG